MPEDLWFKNSSDERRGRQERCTLFESCDHTFANTPAGMKFIYFHLHHTTPTASSPILGTVVDYTQQASKHHAGQHLNSVLMMLVILILASFWLFYI